MPLPLIAGITRVALNWRASNGQTATNVMHFRQNGSSPAALFATIEAAVSDDMWNTVQDGCSVEEVCLLPLNGEDASVCNPPTTPADWTGGRGGQFIPAAATLVSFATGIQGRSHRGRIYLPFLPEGSQDAGRMIDDETTTMQAAWSAFLTAMDSADRNLVVASYTEETALDVTSVTVEQAIATQRRRQTRVRRNI